METTVAQPNISLLVLYLSYVGLPAAVFATLGAVLGSRRTWMDNSRASLVAGAGLATASGLFVLGLLWLLSSNPTTEYWFVGLIVLAHVAGWSAAGATVGSFLGSLRSLPTGIVSSPVGAVLLGLVPFWFVL